MISLKDYQRRSLDALTSFFKSYTDLKDVEMAFLKVTRDTFGRGLLYNNVSELPGLPYVCLRIPTGGGKTIVACHSIERAAKELLRTDNPVVLWLVPSNTIREQTIKALQDKTHPYYQAVETYFPSFRALSIQEALYVTRPTLATGATIIISTIQAFRVDDTEGRKVYEQSGALMEHFTGIDDALLESLDKYENGQPVQSLANLLKLHRPIVIVDEAHNARTGLSFETLARFNPSCIIEFTATPDTKDSPSNVLHSVSAAELKADNMIKLPIRLETRPNWKELLGDAIAMRKHLEEVAITERKKTGEYIRPIMLIQAQAKSQNHETLTVEAVEQCLLDDFQIPADEIKRATGTDKGIEGLDLSKPGDVRYIITVQALREGWDCPFAYVLCSVAEMKSSTAVEQILGRIMRLPKAEKKINNELNMAYAFSASKTFADAANALKDALIQNGFDKQEAKDLILPAPTNKQGELEPYWHQVVEPVPETPNLETLTPEISEKVTFDEKKGEITFKGVMAEPEKQALQNCFKTEEGKAAVERVYRKTRGLPPERPKSPAERGETFSVPVLCIQQDGLFEQFEAVHFLDMPWRLSQCEFTLAPSDYSEKPFDGQVAEIDVSDKGKISTKFIEELQEQMSLLTKDQSQTVAQLAHWLDKNIPHPDIIPEESGAFLTALINFLITERGFTLPQLFHDKYTLRQKVAAKIEAHRNAAHVQSYQQLLIAECATPLTVQADICFSFDPDNYPYNSKYTGSHIFNKHYYRDIGALNGEEEACAIFLDTLPEVKFWVRNIEKCVRHSFWLQTSTDKFYPDFVCLLNDGRFLAVEYKGADRWSDDDSREKRNLGELWEKRSNGKCLFVMPKGKDLAAIKAKFGI